MVLSSRFSPLLASVAGNKDRTVLEVIYNHLFGIYDIPRKDYHNSSHIEHCLRELDESGHANIPVELALFYHDAVYDPKEKDNEKRSADWAAYDLTVLQVPINTIVDVKRLIMATKHDVFPNGTDDEKLIADIDLSILGQESKIFDHYCVTIREEYSHVEDYGYAKGRIAFLKKLMQRPSIYQTDYFFNKYEIAARENVEWEIKRMHKIKMRDQM